MPSQDLVFHATMYFVSLLFIGHSVMVALALRKIVKLVDKHLENTESFTTNVENDHLVMRSDLEGLRDGHRSLTRLLLTLNGLPPE